MELSEVRKNIDRVDQEIKKLFVERMGLAEQVAQVKAKTEDDIYKPEREEAIIQKQSKDMTPELVMEYKALIKRIMAVSRKYQYGRTLELRDCFPFSFETEEFKPSNVAMIRPELYICRGYSKDDVHTYATFEEIGEAIGDGRADFGMGIIEEVGSGVSDQLNNMLVARGLYINTCEIVEDKEARKKVVGFSKHLVVREMDNRLKLAFVCPNTSGALGNVLSMISAYGVNLTEIHSFPYRDGDSWNYRFYVELGLNLLKKEAKALVFQLSAETIDMQLLGSYFCEGDF